MCEPAHSIVQYPDDFDSDLPTGKGDGKESTLKAVLGKGFDWTKKIGKWFHLSKFGAGHHENTGSLNYRSRIYMPSPILWEGLWWERKFHFDGLIEPDPGQIQRDAAKTYHNRSVMGNMSLFRRFLEKSMIESKQGAYSYVEALLEHVFTAEGVNKLLEKFRRVFGRSATPARLMSQRSTKQEVEKGIKVVMGFTRRRGLFLPHFADDDSLWVPGSKVGR